MKKLYFLNEEEKKRILKLHREKQFRYNFLNEQTTSGIGAGSDYTPGTTSSDMDMNAYKSNVNKSILKKCQNASPVNVQPALNIFKKATEGSGYMAAETYSKVKGSLEMITNEKDFCGVFVQYRMDTGGKNMFYEFQSYLYTDSLEDDLARIIAEILKLDMSGNIPTKSSDELDYDDIEDNEGNDDDDIFRPGPKEIGKLVPGPKDPTWKKNVLRIYKKYPCFKGKVEMTEAVNVFRIQNPAMLDGIVELIQGRRTKSKIDTPLDLNVSDQTYQSEKDYMNNIVPSGKFSCSVNGKYIELTPTEAITAASGIADKFKCLKAFGAQQDEGEPTMATMRDGDRLRHPQLSGYPSGDIYFNIDGTFLTYDDDLKGSTESGTFECGGKLRNRLKVTSYHGADYTTIPFTPTPPKTEEPKPEEKKSEEKKSEETKKSEESKKVIPQPVIGMGTVMSSVQGEIAGILQCANITGSDLTQSNLNLLYQYIKNNKK